MAWIGITLYWTVPRTSAWLPFLSENHRPLQPGIRSNLLHNLRLQRIFAHDGPCYRVREPPVHAATEYLLDCLPKSTQLESWA